MQKHNYFAFDIIKFLHKMIFCFILEQEKKIEVIRPEIVCKGCLVSEKRRPIPAPGSAAIILIYEWTKSIGRYR